MQHKEPISFPDLCAALNREAEADNIPWEVHGNSRYSAYGCIMYAELDNGTIDLTDRYKIKFVKWKDVRGN